MVKIRSKSFSLFIFFEKRSNKPHFFNLFLFHIFSLIIFHFFFHHFPSLITFFLSSFCFISFCFSPLLFSLFLHSFSTSLPPCFSFFFSFSCFFFHRRFCVSSFCFNTHLFFSLFCSWSHSSFLPSSLFFLRFRICFCRTKYKFFSFLKNMFFFWTLSLLCRFCLVCSMFSDFSRFLILHFFFFVNQSSFWSFKKLSFCFLKKVAKKFFGFSFPFSLKKKLLVILLFVVNFSCTSVFFHATVSWRSWAS